jgi:hypothetical protein
MKDRFALSWEHVDAALDRLLGYLQDDHHLFVKAFDIAQPAKVSIGSVLAAKKSIRQALMISEPPWILFDTVSELVGLFPSGSRAAICAQVQIATGLRAETLRLTTTGLWQLGWELGVGQSREPETLLLDFYRPPERDRVPFVPAAIVDNISACASLLRDGLLSPAATLLMVSFESALWRKLESMNIQRTTERITFEAVDWHFKRITDKLFIEFRGATAPLSALDALAGVTPAVGSWKVRRVVNGDNSFSLSFEAGKRVADLVSSSLVERTDTVPEKGLAEAIGRARANHLLDSMPLSMDVTVQRLRNALVHLPADGKIDPSIPLTGGNSFATLEEIRSNSRFVGALAGWLVRQINELCAN